MPEFRLWFMLAMLFGVFVYVGWAGKPYSPLTLCENVLMVLQLAMSEECIGSEPLGV